MLNHEQIIKESQRITKIKPFIDKYNWEGVNYAWQKDDWKKNWENNLTIVLDVFYTKTRKKYIWLCFKT